jgi:hypothetical protein
MWFSSTHCCVGEDCLGSVWEGHVSRVGGVLGWGPEAARFYDGVKDFVGEDSVFIVWLFLVVLRLALHASFVPV